MNRREREIRKTIKDNGLQIVTRCQNSHMKIKLRNGRGEERIFVMSVSSSDQRGIRNDKAMLERFAKGDGR